MTLKAPLPFGRPLWTGTFLPPTLLLCFAIAVGLGLYTLVSLRAALVQEKGAHLARTAVRVANTLDRVLFERFGDIQVFANDKVLLDGSAEEKTKRLIRYKELYWYYSWIGVTDETGRIIAATDLSTPQDKGVTRKGLGDGPALNRGDWFETMRRTKQVHLEEAQLSPESAGGMAVGFSAPIFGPQEDFRGVVTSRVLIENLRGILEQEGKLQSEEEVYDWLLLDRRGGIIIEKNHTEPLEDNLLDSRLPSAIHAATDPHRPGFVEEPHQRRQISLVTGYARTRGYGTFSGFDWTVLVRVERERVYAPIDRLIWAVGGIGLLLVAPLTGFGVWASSRLAREHRDLVKVRQALEASVAELSRSNADLQQFAYVASHDLQEPLRMVGSYTQLLAKRYKGKLDSDADEFIGYAVEGATRMQRLIQDLLAYSRVNTQNRTLEPVSVETIVDDALKHLRGAMDESRAVVTRDPLPTVLADERQLLQLFQNLLSNALKFRGEQPLHIHVSAVQQDNEWLFLVRDNGIGIDPQYADRIFVLFQRLHTIAEYPGTGIGLAICKKIVERHGGRIWMESQLGKGATFYFTIPMNME